MRSLRSNSAPTKVKARLASESQGVSSGFVSGRNCETTLTRMISSCFWSCLPAIRFLATNADRSVSARSMIMHTPTGWPRPSQKAGSRLIPWGGDSMCTWRFVCNREGEFEEVWVGRIGGAEGERCRWRRRGGVLQRDISR